MVKSSIDLKIRWSLFKDENEPVTRHRGIRLIECFQEYDWDVDVWDGDETADILVHQYQPHQLAEMRDYCDMLVYDMADPVFLPPHSWAEMFPLIGGPDTLEFWQNEVDWITTCSKPMAEWMSKWKGPCVTCIHEPVEPVYYEVQNEPIRENNILWIGQRATMPYLRTIAETIDDALERAGGGYLTAVAGDNKVTRRIARELPFDVNLVEWSIETAIEELSRADIAIAPIRIDTGTMMKAQSKAAMYMVCGVPSIVTDIPSYDRIIDDGNNGFLCRTVEDWREASNLVLTDDNQRDNIANKAMKIREEVSVEQTTNRMAELFYRLYGVSE